MKRRLICLWLCRNGVAEKKDKQKKAKGLWFVLISEFLQFLQHFFVAFSVSSARRNYAVN
jgi:hypothetical protein